MMGKEELTEAVRSVLGHGFSDMDIIRALHMANNDVTGAINIILDTPKFSSGEKTSSQKVREQPKSEVYGASSMVESSNLSRETSDDMQLDRRNDTFQACSIKNDETKELDDRSIKNESVSRFTGESLGSINSNWWFVGSSDITALSTCKGRKLKVGEIVSFSFPFKNSPPSHKTSGKLFGRGRPNTACSEIVRFSTKYSGEIGRIPTEWARSLLPLVKAGKVQIEGSCKSAPDTLSIMDTITLSVSVYINSSMFRKRHQASPKSFRSLPEDSTVHPLPVLFRLLGLTPFKKAEFMPEDFYSRKRSLDLKDSSGVCVPLLPPEKIRKLSSDSNRVENEQEENISDSDVDKLVGTSDSSELEEMDPPHTLQCELRPYQKQALHWMVQLEKGRCLDEAGTALHPCWDAYHLADPRDLVVYINAFSGDATTEFPSALQMSRGGILADAMGLGKTIMTIALLLSHSDKGGSGSGPVSQHSSYTGEVSSIIDHSPDMSEDPIISSGFSKLVKLGKISHVSGGNLIVCPMTLLGQWKAEIEAHVEPGSLSLYVHYGQSRPKDAKVLTQYDVVLTTYGVLASEFQAENAEDNGGLYSVRWFRVVLDEAHTIKSTKSQTSMAAAALTADRRWCLTGTPIQNNLEDIYSLLRFLRVEPWSNWGLWHKLIQKPFEEGDERGLKIVQTILRPIMLRRTKSSTDKEGRPMLVLPPADVEVIYCELTEAEKDFYEALFKRSKVKFDQFVEQGRVLHNYASILELLLRLRQCCDHPFLVMSRGDTQEYSDLNKLAKRFLKVGQDALIGENDVAPSRAYIQEVVEDLRKGEKGECPICLEVFEDSVLTPCAHRLCRECLLASWRNANSGICPVCRKILSRQDLITVPSESRFQIDVDKNWVESSKVSVLLQQLEILRSLGSKSIVISQWTAFLDLLQIPLSRKNIKFVRLDGTLNQQQREKVIRNFTEDTGVLVMLLSLKAGGVGINLTAASAAFLLVCTDPWWNPAVEEQAVMRVHRIGQTKRVAIKRFIVKGTVEERMEAVQARKQRMISGALTDQEVRTARIEELKMLFT
ncbi:putative SWI/SNF-related matrix-associated actin-dependent regulator of chromatin subfamily A member 3-like 2 isoform X1 [Amborella trichopoda]|uniref:putative SWI/SNF-related matrix-associated actin-dependent regulator of chromatin subfamily A member 3-like 2 isoform X1 n=1 Tax=Amborella trichopoda TaxID=13333 RepID=UPI0009BFF6AF|nr:putative SWI/SNF-related matrix-associated actin-dependent regulator of chromatin subfamily A member 3-like 2 isoform X1 [Amborella trichopoda]XP_020527313.1 putative SWI/SNF-related matrix-associated actin-dependent regulator of chromatin subfamily A member 3-like 2 isoform X1 [Amborella trichopoda]XP_020527314.1 putative SWI/SNF-related matrix-associated actin-dependent regulator of chromatin subfamily A member 3-like 2 isoform X1 [Amborella trichopoda]XP_020527315.1 putative SWI/SNF-relate|eukprot:XP_020527312.1 putative SWI/SNF-related matrix-associated actin-dependent regulator of chromatin subfamily A member 3-like 2 isoform X1 [Amborella trichopoda]